MANDSTADAQILTSIACHNADVSADSQRSVEDNTVVTAGVTNKLSFNVRQGQSCSHNFAVCCLLPGLYQLYLYSTVIDFVGPSHGSKTELPSSAFKEVQQPKDFSVRTTFILVE